MADELKVSITAVAEGLTAGLQKATSEIQTFGNQVSGIAKTIQSAFIGFAGGAIVLDQIKKTVEAAVEAQSAFVHLKDSVEISGASFEKMGGQIERSIASLRETTRFSRIELTEGLTSIIQLTGDVALAMKALPAVADLAAARHMEFARAADLVAKGTEGMVTQLRRAGIAFSEGEKAAIPFGTEAERLEVIMGKLNAKFGGAAQGDLDSYAAGIKRIGNEMQEARAKIGEGLIGMGQDLYNLLKDVGIKTGFGGGGMTLAEAIAAANQQRTIDALQQAQGRAPTSDQARALAAMQSDIAAGALINKKDLEDARKAAEEEAKRIAKVYSDMLQKLSSGTTDAGVKFKALVDVLGASSDGWLKAGTNIQGVERLLKELGVTAIDTGRAIISIGPAIDLRTKGIPVFGAPGTALSQAAMDQANAEEFKKRQDQELETEHEKQIIAWEAQGARLAREREAILHLADDFARHVSIPLTSAFTDLLTTGGKNIGTIMAQAFADEVQRGAQSLFSGIIGALGGGQIKDLGNGKFSVNGQVVSSHEEALRLQQQNLVQNAPGVAAGMNFAGGLAQGYNAQTSDLENATGALVAAVGTVATLASVYGSLAAIPVYGWIAAAALAVGQVVGKLLQPSPGSTYQYATGIGTNAAGVFGGTPNTNIDKNTWTQMVAAGQATFEGFYNSYYKLLMKFPTELLPDVSKAFGAVYGRFEDGADLGKAASEKFGQEFASFLASGLPHQIADRFNQYLKADFATLGVTADAFNATWAKLILLDPKAQVQALNDWADALLTVNDALANLKLPTGFAPVNFNDTNFWGGGTVLSQNAGDAAKTYADKLADADKKILDFGKGLDHLVGPELLANEKQLAQMVADRYALEKQQIKEIQTAMVQAVKSIQQQSDAYKLEGMVTATGEPDVAGQINFLKNRADLLYQQLGSAPDAASVLAIQKELQAVIDQIVQLGKSQGPEAAAAYLAWGQQVLGDIQTAVLDRLTALGQAIDTVNQQFLGQFQPIYDTFLQGLAGAGAGASTLSTSLDDAGAAASHFADKVNDASTALAYFISTLPNPGAQNFVSNTVGGR